MSPASDSQQLQPLLIGTVLDGRYRIDSVLGTGAMACVYLGEHLGIGRTVAIKVLRADLGGSQDAARRFKREALASGRLDHPNIVGVSDFGVLEDGSSFLVMEALEGESLGRRLDREQRIPWPEAIELMRGVLRALDHAHEHGVVHRDIKPDNIFLATQAGRPVVKLLDFGIAKLVAGAAGDPVVTCAGMTIGTPGYLSPEQAVGGAITAASDLYSATVVLFEMLTGRPVFEEKDVVAMMMAHIKVPARTLAEAAPDLTFPPRLEEVVRLGLQKRVADRIASAAEYLELLDDIEPRARGSAIRETPDLDPPEPAPRPISMVHAVEPVPRSWFVGGGVALGCALVVGILAAVAGGPAATPAEDAAAGRDVQLKALLYDLQEGKTCPERRAAIPKLVALDDPKAIPALRAARDRLRGGTAGSGQTNTNECLRRDAEAAIKTLGRSR